MVLVWVVVFAFVMAMAVVLIPTLMERIAVTVHCPGAQEVIHSSQRSGSIGVQGGGTMATTTATLRCVFADGTEKTIDNDPIFITGIGVALLLGTATGVIVALVRRLLRR